MKNIKKQVLIIISCLAFVTINAQSTNQSGVDVGFQLNNYAGDFGLGINVSSPYLFGEGVRLKARVNAMFLEYIENGETTWEPYLNVTVGSFTSARISDAVGLYGEGGLIVVFPSDQFSSTSSHFGGYGLFGFEFYFSDSFTYFIEAGGIGVGAVANKVENKPIYSNGFLTSVGCKAKF